MARFTHVNWRDLPIGHRLRGTWLPLRLVAKKDGTSYQLGEVEHRDGQRTGFTMPLALAQKVDKVAVGTLVKIQYDGSKPLNSGRTMLVFQVWTLDSWED